jgi:hypothetical protein
MANREVTYAKVLTTDTSFGLVRTNPKLTGNIKLVINESGNMWLNAIKANGPLSNDYYSKVPVDTTRSHATNVYSFFNKGAVPNEIIFDLQEKVDVTKTSNNYKDQFDFSHYFSGARYLTSNKYEERLSYFAPIYLNKELPNYFIIFKIKDPLNSTIAQSKSNYESGQTNAEYLRELFKKGSIIKTFDLSESSTPGKYLRDYTGHVNFPISPLTVSFEEDQLTSWNGIVVSSGVFGSRGEYLDDLYTQSTPLKFFEENITNGFSRNGIIFPNILNLEFAFNDETSSKYDINRYVGVYVNTVNLSNLGIDLDEAWAQRSTWENDSRFRKPWIVTDEIDLPQTNPNGVIFPVKDFNLNLSEFSQIFSNTDNLYFNYLSDRDGKLHLPKLENPYTIKYSDELDVAITYSAGVAKINLANHGILDGQLVTVSNSGDAALNGEWVVTLVNSNQVSYIPTSTVTLNQASAKLKIELRHADIRVADTSLNLGKFFGPSKTIFLQDEGFQTDTPGYSHLYFKIGGELSHLDQIKIYHPQGTLTDSTGRHELITITHNYSLVPNAGDFYVYNDYDQVLGSDEFYINGKGYPQQIANALAGAINGIRNSQFTAYAVNEWVFVKLRVPGEFDSQYAARFYSPTLAYLNTSVHGKTDGSLVNFVGGSPEKGNRLIIDAGHLGKITDKLNLLLVKSSNSWSTIRKVSNWIDPIVESNLTTEALRKEVINSYTGKIAIVLAENEIPTVTNKEFVMKLQFQPEFGLLSLFPIKDIDFNFYQSEYLNFPTTDLYTHYFIPAERDLLSSDFIYEVKGAGVIDIEGVQYSTGDQISLPFSNIPYRYSIVSGTPFVSYSATTSDLIVPLNDANSELKNFTGFSILKDPSKVVTANNSESYQLRTKYLNGLTSTEYDFFKENDSLDFATRSKIIPYITKWGIKNGRDVRDNPYRLNTELVFGRNNFAPSHDDRTQNPSNFTHEWFYIESKFNYVDDLNTVKENTEYFELPFDLTQFLSNPDYFTNYFTYTPTYPSPAVSALGSEVGKTQLRYTSLFKNAASQYEAFFKGFKILFSEYLDETVLGSNGRPVASSISSRFENCKFSCILKPVKEDLLDDTQPPVKFKIIEHRDYKSIVIVIEIAIGDISEINDYWKTTPTSIENVGFDGTYNNFTDPNYSVEFGGAILPYQTINGDYRIKFDQTTDVSNLTHTMLYSLKHKKFNNRLNNFANAKLSSKLSLAISGPNGIDSATGTIKLLENPNTPKYTTLLSNEIVKPNDYSPIRIHDKVSNFDFFISPINGFTIPTVTVNSITGALTDFLTYDNTSGLSLIVADTASPAYVTLYNTLPSSGNTIIKNNWTFSVVGGGENTLEKLFESISFANFKKLVNSGNPVIEYYSYSLNSQGVSQSISPKFYIEIVEPSEIVKKSQVIPIVTTQIPTQFSSTEAIGYDYEQATLSKVVELNRYAGEYEPLFTQVLTCNSKFKFTKNKIDTISLANISINPNVDDLFTVKDFAHIKIAPASILALESDDAYLPKYPKINEIPIGRANYFLLRGNWDWGFHFKYLNKVDYSPVAGSLRIEEDDAFLAKLITLPAQIELENFLVTSIGELDTLENVNLDNYEIVLKNSNLKVDGFINLNNVITRYLIEDGITQKFTEFLSVNPQYTGNYQTINDYVAAYIKQNILKLYQSGATEFWVKPDASLASENTNPNTIEFTFLNDTQRFNGGYSLNRSLQINKFNNLILKFSFTKKLGAGLKISPKIKINFI